MLQPETLRLCGISLINNITKILSKILTIRILSYSIENNYIRPENFGLMNKEECINLFLLSEKFISDVILIIKILI